MRPLFNDPLTKKASPEDLARQQYGMAGVAPGALLGGVLGGSLGGLTGLGMDARDEEGRDSTARRLRNSLAGLLLGGGAGAIGGGYAGNRIGDFLGDVAVTSPREQMNEESRNWMEKLMLPPTPAAQFEGSVRDTGLLDALGSILGREKSGSEKSAGMEDLISMFKGLAPEYQRALLGAAAGGGAGLLSGGGLKSTLMGALLGGGAGYAMPAITGAVKSLFPSPAQEEAITPKPTLGAPPKPTSVPQLSTSKPLFQVPGTQPAPTLPQPGQLTPAPLDPNLSLGNFRP